MRTGIHPEYVVAEVRCSCGNTFSTRSTKPVLHVELCSACHPFYTGTQKLVDTGGRIDKFERRYGKRGARAEATATASRTTTRTGSTAGRARQSSSRTPRGDASRRS